MDTTDLLSRWSALSLDEIQLELDAGKNLAAAEQLFGAEAVAAMRGDEETRALSGPPEAVVFLPGLMGSLLSSVRGAIKSLWLNPALFLKGESRDLELNQKGNADRSPNILATPVGCEKLCYIKPILAFHRACQLFEFPYDWRRPIQINSDLLSRALERWAGDDPKMQFTLVGHSMGGLVARAFVARHTRQAKRRIKRVIMHGTPQFGAAGAVADLREGNQMMAMAGALNNDNDLRRFALNLPSVYQLLPAPPGIFPEAQRAYPANFDLYDARQWRTEGIRQDYLDEGRRFHELLANLNHPVPMIAIAGCHLETKVDALLEVDAAEQTSLDVKVQSEGADSGDGTVPLYSARLPGAQMYYIQEVHRYLTRNDQVIRATIDLVYGRTPDLPTQLPQPRGGILDRFRAVGDPESEAARLRQRLTDGVATERDLEQLYFLDF